MSNAEESHRIAAEAASNLVKKSVEAGLDWPEIAVACETAVAIVVSACAKMASPPSPGVPPNREAFAREMVETITERAHSRVQALLRGVPYDG